MVSNHLGAEHLKILPGTKRYDEKTVRQAFHYAHAVLSDGAGGAENAQSLAYSHRFRKESASQSAGAPNSRLSIRSRKPPCPGSRVPESFWLAPRLIADSTRSPTWPAIATQPAK